MINGLTFDGATTNPMEMAVRDAMIAFMAVNVGNRIAVAVPSQRRRVPVSDAWIGPHLHRSRPERLSPARNSVAPFDRYALGVGTALVQPVLMEQPRPLEVGVIGSPARSSH